MLSVQWGAKFLGHVSGPCLSVVKYKLGLASCRSHVIKPWYVPQIAFPFYLLVLHIPFRCKTYSVWFNL